MKVRYDHIFANGGFTHSVTIYENWTAEQGLADKVAYFENRRADKLLREVRDFLSYPQIEKIKSAMKYRDNAAFNEHGIAIR